jgi:hypothetical protein
VWPVGIALGRYDRHVRSLRAGIGLGVLVTLCAAVSGCADNGPTQNTGAAAAKAAYIEKADALCKSELKGSGAVLVSVGYFVGGTNSQPIMTSNVKSATRSEAPLLAHERAVLAKLVALPRPAGSNTELTKLWVYRTAELDSQARSAHFLLSQPKITDGVMSEDRKISQQTIQSMSRYQAVAKSYGLRVCGNGPVA